MIRRSGQGRASLASWALAAGLVAALAVLRVAAAPAEAQELTPAERTEASQLYAVHCAHCHGGSGAGAIVPGTELAAPPIIDVPVALMDLVIRTGRMPPAGDPWDSRPRSTVLDERQREILVEHLRAQFDLPGDIPRPPDGDPAAGRPVYEINCAACHGAVGAGGVAGGGAFTPRINHYEVVTLAQAIRTGPFQMPAFAPEQISDQEVADLAAFLAAIHSEQGTLILGLTELNPVFASAFVALLSLVTIVGLLWIAGRPARFADPETAESPEEQ